MSDTTQEMTAPHFTISRRGFMKVLGAAAATALLPACGRVEGTGRRQLLLLSPAQVAGLGAEAFAEISAGETLNQDPRIQASVDRVWQHLLPQLPQQGANQWEIKAFASPTQNAFALPGGKVAIYTGILPLCGDEAGLAAVVGHEMAHIVANHGAERMSQQFATGMVLEIANAGLGASSLDPSTHRLAVAALGAAGQVGILLPFSRTHEYEADHLGARYLAAAGYDPQAAVELWQRFAEMGGSGGPEWLSTHPASINRVQRLQQQMGEYQALQRASAQQWGRGASLL